MLLPRLNFPEYNFKLQKASPDGQSIKIFDKIRGKYVLLTPEEWVRQHLIQYMLSEKGYPSGLLSVEKKIKVNGLTKRTDVLVYDKKGLPLLLAECKAPQVSIDQKVFDQAARYNMVLGVQYYVLSNGIQTICCKVDHELQKYQFLEEFPSFTSLSF